MFMFKVCRKMYVCVLFNLDCRSKSIWHLKFFFVMHKSTVALCLFFRTFYPKYAYSCYAYKKKLVYTISNINYELTTRKTIYLEKERMIEEAKTTNPEQNAINLSSKASSPAEKSLLKKDPSFVPTPTDINWCNLRQDFDSFASKLRFHALKTENNHVENNTTSTALSVETFQNGNPPVKAKSPNINFTREKTNVDIFETFIELVEKDLSQPCNYNKAKSNITKEERNALKNIQHDELRSYRVQDKGSRFVVLDNEDYIEKINYQFGRSSFEELDYDPSKAFSERVNLWIQRWTRNNVLCKTWQKFIEPSHVTPGKMHGLVKTKLIILEEL